MATYALCFSQPPRTAHPMVQFSCQPCEPMVIENIPFDKYELEPSPLTQYILERRQPNTCWQVCTPPHQYTPMLASQVWLIFSVFHFVTLYQGHNEGLGPQNECTWIIKLFFKLLIEPFVIFTTSVHYCLM